MKKATALRDYLLGLNFLTKAELTVVAEVKNNIAKQWRLFSQTRQEGFLSSYNVYDARFTLSGFSEKVYSQDELIVIINQWLLKNDTFYNPLYNHLTKEGATFEIGFLITNYPLDLAPSAQLELQINFTELLVLIEDNAGKIEIDNKTYRIADSSLEAENFEIDFLKNR